MALPREIWVAPQNRIFTTGVNSNAQPLPNGNTLINEGWFGHFFEVTRAGEVVWEYVNPYFTGQPHALLNMVFRAYRYSAQEIECACATGR